MLPKSRTLISRQALARKFNISPYRVNHYLRNGRLVRSVRRAKNQRFFEKKIAEDILRQILRLEAKGFSWKMIEAVLKR